MKKVLVIVVTYNGRKWLDRCLGSVAGDGRSESAMTVQADLFVVDNDSTDGSADYVAAHFPQAHLVRSAENLGFSKANNLGFDYALKKGYDYVYLLNQDAWLAPGALETLVAAAQAHPNYAVLSPLQYQDGYQAFDPQFAKLYHGSAEVKRIMAAHWLVPVAAIWAAEMAISSVKLPRLQSVRANSLLRFCSASCALVMVVPLQSLITLRRLALLAQPQAVVSRARFSFRPWTNIRNRLKFDYLTKK